MVMDESMRQLPDAMAHRSVGRLANTAAERFFRDALENFVNVAAVRIPRP
jgi:hypothetical protein